MSPRRADALFASPGNSSRALSKNAISLFLRRTINTAYSTISPRITNLTRVNAHEIRAVATSLRFKYNLNQVSIIKGSATLP